MRERKLKKIYTPRRVFLVVCEGETEREYVEALKRRFRLPVAIKTKVSGNQINARLIKEYVRELGLLSKDEYHVFYIYDSDVKSIVDKLRQLEGTLILSNPCIELWFMLHSSEHNRATTSDEMVRRLKQSHSAWAHYSKGYLSNDQLNLLFGHVDEAATRARLLDWPENPSTNAYKLIDALNEAKNG